MGFIEIFTWTYVYACSHIIFARLKWLPQIELDRRVIGSSSPIAYRKPASLRRAYPSIGGLYTMTCC
jgi:hypothetical protein